MVAVFPLVAIILFSSMRPARAEVPDVSWPVKTHPTETALNGEIKTLEALIRKIDARKLDSSYARSALVLARDFIVYARDDEKNGRPGRAAYARSYLDESLGAAISDARALLANPRLNRPVPRPALRNISIRDGAFLAGGEQVMFGGVGHFSQVRADIPKFPDYGFNLIQIEIGPSSVVTGPGSNDIRTDSIDNNVIKTLDRAAQNGVMVNLLLSPHYFPDWALKMYPELKKCGKGFIQYCVSDPDARRVLRRYLQVLIPKVKDKPALQSYTLANEPLFMEQNDETLRRFRLALSEKYGDVSALNRAWRKKYASFESVKISEDFLNLNSAARLDWVTFHNKIGTECFYWMKSVMRTMD
ncbi:MAG TPA: beta-galactosidase, partial [bacterium]|nr:beta-galactosidase [bacterium]